MKKFLFCAIMAITALTCALLPITTARAEEPTSVEASIVNRSETTLYHVISDPSDILSTPSGLYIGSSSGYELYFGGTIAPCELVADELAYTDGLILLSGGSITYGENTISGEFTSISSSEDTLYALHSGGVKSFSAVGGELIEVAEFERNGVQKIAATSDGFIYAYTSDGYTTVMCGDSLLGTFSEPIVDLGYSDGRYYVLTHRELRVYPGLFSEPVSQPAIGAVALSIGDAAYVLTQTGSVERFSLLPGTKQTIIASSGELDWFYQSPSGIDTRLNKIYVADRSLGRIAVIDSTGISYIRGLSSPTAVVADNTGTVYVAHSGNKVAAYSDGSKTDEFTVGEAAIIDLEVDYANNLYCLNKNGDVLDLSGNVQMSGVKAMEFHSDMIYMTSDHIGDIELVATDFCLDIMGNIFAVSGNTLTAIIGGVRTDYTVTGARSLSGITVSKVKNDYISYGDILLIDEDGKCVLSVPGKEVGSANAEELFSQPELSDEPNPLEEGIAGVASIDSFMFALPVEGEIVRPLTVGEKLIVIKEVESPRPFLYCAVDTSEDTMKLGYVYETVVDILDYSAPSYSEAKINAEKTPIYKYPSIHAPQIATCDKNTIVALLPFAVNSIEDDIAWYKDTYGYKWYRIAHAGGEGFVLASNTNVDIFSNEVEMPKTNATITQNAELYRYDDTTGTYVKFEAAGVLAKDTRVAVHTPFDTSVKYTKVVFYRDGLGIIDVECFVETKYIDFDGVDIVKIVAICVIALAAVILGILIVRKLLGKRQKSSQP